MMEPASVFGRLSLASAFRLTGLLLSLVPQILISQSPQQTEDLLRLSVRHGRQFEIDKNRAVRFADSLKIPVRQRLTDGRVIELMGFERGMPVYFVTLNAEGAEMIKSHLVYPGSGSGLDLTGLGQTLGIWDEAWVMENHQEFTDNDGSRVTHKDGAGEVSFHATHVAGTLAAQGVDSTARGMSWRANIDSYDWNDDASEMAAAAADGLKVSQHSYGSVAGWSHGSHSGEDGWHWFGDVTISETEDYAFGFYSRRARAWDDIAYHAPNYLIVVSAGNDRGQGPDPGEEHYVFRQGEWRLSTMTRERDGGVEGYNSMPGSSNSKNVITVGAIRPDGLMAGFSGWGPTDDGRIKPDIVAKGVSVYSPVSSGTASYSFSGGTSMSGPMISGSVGLLLEHQENLNPGVSLLSSTIRALIIHTADDNLGGAPGPDYRFGWGLMNTAAAAALMTGNHEADGINIMENELAEGGEITVAARAGAGPLRATLVWTDVPGITPAPELNPSALMLVNDLDMRISDNNNNQYMPYAPDPANPELPADTGDNFRDNVEVVHIDAPVEGMIYLIRINHKGTLNGGSQAFSLVISGNVPVSDVIRPRNLTATADGAHRIDLEWIRNDDQDNVMLLWSPDNTFGIPETGVTYNAGEPVPGGGIVLYKGNETKYEHTGLDPVRTYYYQAISFDESYEYSPGITAKAVTGCGVISSLPFREDFDASRSLPACWLITDHQENEQIWQVGVHSGGLDSTAGNYAFINSHEFGPEGIQNSSLVTPEFDFSAYTEVTISFTHFFRTFDRSAATFLYSTDGGTTWTRVTQWTEGTPNPAYFRQIIPDIAGQSHVRMKWNYSGNGEWFWNIDNVEITGTPVSGLPVITTTTVYEIGTTTATSGGVVIAEGDSEVSAAGVVWSSSQVPSTEENDGIATNGEGGGEFITHITGLSPGTTYLVRAWATNISGTSYGNTTSFQTLETSGPFTINFEVTDQSGNPVPGAIVAISRGKWETAPVSLNKSIIANDQDEPGEWIHWDDGMNESKIGMSEAGYWTSAIRFETSDLTGFEGQILTRVRLVVYDPADDATLVIWQGTYQHKLREVVRQQFTQSEKSWVTIELNNPYAIDTGQELWIGVEWNDPGADVFPAGVDRSTDHDGKGNLIIMGTYPDGWSLLSDYPVSQGDWNLQALITERPVTVITDEAGHAVLEVPSGDYTFTVYQDGYQSESGNIQIAASDKLIEVTLYEHFGLTLVADPPEGGTFEGAGQYREGVRAAITALAREGYLFTHWSGDTQYADDLNSESTAVTMPAGDITLTANFNFVTGTETITPGVTELVPNPFSDFLRIINASGIGRIAILDPGGRIIVEMGHDGSESHTINTEGLPAGIYFVILYGRDGQTIARTMVKNP